MNIETLPQIVLPTLVLSLLADSQGRLWAGGMGGVALYEGGQWLPKIAGLPVTGVTALALAGSWLWAGGAEGIARSSDDGQSWQAGLVQGSMSPVAALAVSPTFAQDSSLLAATLAGGVLRSEDAGQSWSAANFGLGDYEITSLVWPQPDLVLAGTVNGIYRSPNGGRAWRQAAGSEGIGVAALACLDDGRIVAALEGGGLLVSADGGTWSALTNDLPAEIEPAALHALAGGGLLLGTLDAGSFRSDDGGSTWKSAHEAGAFAFAESGGVVYAGTGTDVFTSDDGHNFTPITRPPLHDLRHLVTVGDSLLVYGRYSGALWYESEAWHPLTAISPPLGLLRAAPDGSLYVSSMEGLYRWQAGADWETLIEGPTGYFSQLVLRADGSGWACSHDYQHLLRTQDGGANWQVGVSPFGVLPLAALEAAPGLVFGVTFDARQNIARMWRSVDDGVNWQAGAEIRTPWPLVATCGDPPLVALGSMFVAGQGVDNWQRGSVIGLTDFLVRQIVGGGGHLLALTTRGLLQSTDGGLNWSPLAGVDLPADEMMSLALIGNTVYVLLVSGRVVWFDV